MSISLSVLIVEDPEDDTLLLVNELKRNGYDPQFERVDTAKAMKAALTRQQWGVVIADHNMPRFSSDKALALKGCIRDNNTPARLGWDEFGILLESCPLYHAEQIADHFRQAIKDFCFEITETTAAAKLGNAVRFITRIKEEGCRFSLDDFTEEYYGYN